jgi:hypothetical protein
MSRANESAYPVPLDTACDRNSEHICGLAVREEFAKAAMKGLCANHDYVSAYCSTEEATALARDAVLLADALIAELAKPVEPKADEVRDTLQRVREWFDDPAQNPCPMPVELASQVRVVLERSKS